MPERLARRVTSLLRLPASALPLPPGREMDKPVDEDWVAVSASAPEFSDFVCGDEPTACPACIALPPDNLAARCVDGVCLVR